MDNCLELVQQHQDLNCKVGRRWAKVEGYEDYFLISDDGILKSLTRIVKNHSVFSKKLTMNANLSVANQYFYRATRKNKQTKNIYIHREVAKAFVPNPFNYKWVHHIDGNRQNNNYTNLRWDMHKHGYRAKLSLKEVIKIRKDIKNGCSRRSLAELYKVSSGTIGHIANNKTWKSINE